MASKTPRFLPTSVVYILIAVVALLFRGTVSETTLKEDYKELCKIIPFDDIIETIRHYNETDDEVKVFLKRLEDPDIKKYALWLYKQPPLHEDMVLEAMRHKGYKKFSHILEAGGLDVDSLRRSLCTMFGWGQRQKKKHAGGLFSKFMSKFFH